MARSRPHRHVRRAAREFPHHVPLPEREGGWGEILDEMHAWAGARCGHEGYTNVAGFRFKQLEDAKAFATTYGLPGPVFTGVILDGPPPKRGPR
jgi:hypothetical protein